MELTVEQLKKENNRLQSRIRDLQQENARLRDENSKLLIDIAFFDRKLPNEQKGT